MSPLLQHASPNVINISYNCTDSVATYYYVNNVKDLITFIILIVFPVIGILGVTGNVLSYIVVTKVKSSSTSFYMQTLAVFDSACLICGIVPVFINTCMDWGTDIRTWSDCRIAHFLLFTSSDVATWTVVAMTIDRCLAVSKFTTVLKYRTLSHAKRVVWLLCVVLSIKNIQVIINYRADYDTVLGINVCIPSVQSEHFVKFVWQWVDFIIYAFLPISAVSISNYRIIVRLNQRNAAFRHVSAIPVTYTAAMTRTLLSISFVMVVCLAPITILHILRAYMPHDTPRSHAIWLLLHTVAEMLMFAHHAVNFFLYCVAGSKFRRKLRDLFS